MNKLLNALPNVETFRNCLFDEHYVDKLLSSGELSYANIMTLNAFVAANSDQFKNESTLIGYLNNVYDGWRRNLYGNIAMFIPVGLILPFCFKSMNTVRKVVLTGFICSLLIETTQLLLYERKTDIDDIILNTAGVLIGGCIYFLAVSVRNRVNEKRKRMAARKNHAPLNLHFVKHAG